MINPFNSLFRWWRDQRENRHLARARANAPTTLDEALDRLEAQLTPEARAYILTADSNGFASALHFSGGMQMRNEWNLWNPDSPLSKWMKERGVWHADDSSSIILSAFHARIRGVPYDLAADVARFRAHWRAHGVDDEGREIVGFVPPHHWESVKGPDGHWTTKAVYETESNESSVISAVHPYVHTF